MHEIHVAGSRSASAASWASVLPALVKLLVFTLGQHAAQALVVRLDGLYRTDDGFAAVFAVRQSHKMVELRLGPQEDGALLGENFLGERPFLAGAGG